MNVNYIAIICLLSINVIYSNEVKITSNLSVSGLTTTTSVQVTQNVYILDSPDVLVQVNGLVCALCAKGIEVAFDKQKAVKRVAINMDTSIVEVQFSLFRQLSDDEIRSIIKSAGYDPVSIERRP